MDIQQAHTVKGKRKYTSHSHASYPYTLPLITLSVSLLLSVFVAASLSIFAFLCFRNPLKMKPISLKRFSLWGLLRRRWCGLLLYCFNQYFCVVFDNIFLTYLFVIFPINSDIPWRTNWGVRGVLCEVQKFVSLMQKAVETTYISCKIILAFLYICNSLFFLKNVYVMFLCAKHTYKSAHK